MRILHIRFSCSIKKLQQKNIARQIQIQKGGIKIEISKNLMYLNISKPILSDQKTNSLIFAKIYSVQELNDFKVYVSFYYM